MSALLPRLVSTPADNPDPMQQPPRWIAHLDMDAFYASVELLRYPQLKGEAVVIGGRRADAPRQLEDGSWQYAKLRHYTGRGVVTTSTYAARDLGVFSAMGLMKAALRAPDAILLPADFDAYRKYSRLFKAAVAEVAPVIEDRGIDEIYIDLSDVPGVRDAVGQCLKRVKFDKRLRLMGVRIGNLVHASEALASRGASATPATALPVPAEQNLDLF